MMIIIRNAVQRVFFLPFFFLILFSSAFADKGAWDPDKVYFRNYTNHPISLWFNDDYCIDEGHSQKSGNIPLNIGINENTNTLFKVTFRNRHSCWVQPKWIRWQTATVDDEGKLLLLGFIEFKAYVAHANFARYVDINLYGSKTITAVKEKCKDWNVKDSSYCINFIYKE